MRAIRIIKTLPHTIPLFLSAGDSYVYAKSYSTELVRMLSSIDVIDAQSLQFSSFLQKINQINDDTEDEGILDDFKAGEPLKFERVEQVDDVLEFSIRGDIISIWLPGFQQPLRLEFFGEELEKLYLYDSATNRKTEDVERLVLTKYLPLDRGLLEEFVLEDRGGDINRVLFTNQSPKGIEDYFETIDFEIIETDFQFPELYYANYDLLEKQIKKFKEDGFRIIVSSKHGEELPDSVQGYLNRKLKIEKETSGPSENSKFEIRSSKGNSEKTLNPGSWILGPSLIATLPAGFLSLSDKLLLLTDRELFGSLYLGQAKASSKSSKTLERLLRQFEGEVSLEDFVVHEDYGIARYKGISQETASGVTSEYVTLEFAHEDELFVPLTQIQKVTRYLSDGAEPKLTKLSRGTWSKLKTKAKADTKRLAKELIEHYAKRELSSAESIADQDSDKYQLFVDAFPYTETKDQITATNEIIHDLEQQEPMNRLLVGDVGFGKTEVAMRAAFKIVENGGQVAVLSPTTILTSQHYKVFVERFTDFDISIEHVSRFITPAKNREIVEKANKGDIDILIGTHRLLSSDINLPKLQLLIVDEEQKFGVKQKEKLKQLNYGVHVLSVSATPIPRTLSLALSGAQDISLITTPPKGRHGVKTEIIHQNWNKASHAIHEEVQRGGQVYVIHNKVRTIQAIHKKLSELVPGVKFEYAHGQMSSKQLQRIMKDFHDHKFDVLISTTIVENGLDLSNVNTMIIHDAHRFGISQLYQLRGRVGRSERQAYCYLMAPKPGIENSKLKIENSKSAIESIKKRKQKQKLYMQRLESLVQNQDLGAGFRMASKDLELRGAGSILGKKQHGHIVQVGYAMYVEMLAQEVERLKNNQ